MYMFWEDAVPDSDWCDLPAATRELRAMRLELAG